MLNHSFSTQLHCLFPTAFNITLCVYIWRHLYMVTSLEIYVRKRVMKKKKKTTNGPVKIQRSWDFSLDLPVVSLLQLIQLIRMPQAEPSRSKRDIKSFRACRESHHSPTTRVHFKLAKVEGVRPVASLLAIGKSASGRDAEVKVTCEFSARSALDNGRWHRHPPVSHCTFPLVHCSRCTSHMYCLTW